MKEFIKFHFVIIQRKNKSWCKMKKQETKIIYFKDEINDEFSGFVSETKKIDKNYKYINNNFFYKIKEFFAYRIIATPIAFLYDKIKFRRKIVNKKILKKVKGAFIYGNHTQTIYDAFNPPILVFPKKNYTIVNPANLGIKFIGKFVPILGGLPVPDDLASYKNFLNAVKHFSNKSFITIYPEAHIWPYYTSIRPFSSKSFKYPIEFNKPAFCFTNVYVKRKFSNKPKIVTYIDGPFYAEGDNLKEKQEDLRNKIYTNMLERSKLNNIEVIKYIKENTND